MTAGTSDWATAVREQEQDEDRRDDEEGARYDASQRSVKPPADVGGDLLGLRTGQEHAEVQRPQVLLLGYPALPLDQLPVHDGDLPGWAAEVDEPELHPEPERLPEADWLGPRLLLELFRLHLRLLHLLTR